ncbi:GGDEF domain-containing protein [Marinomonas rhizomae]|uniref:diguanylate cyclase n=1 Tax=Marinomonas rhizomae TaxID=491948 RepID=A0A366J3R4_9GAMM|nr:GGDEF domain-containing protein [Marinomonas rhizomae]RBP81040.1 diguanylate cyclase [Marinomonas rhizomae]RNF72204.1 GGDEF domain-containing protein [Marinomonas rhizomae]
MTESSSDKLIEALRKAVSRTSMLAEGNDPELDSVVRQIRQVITKGANAQEIQDVLNDAEPLLIKSDEAQINRAKQVRSTLQELIGLLENQDNKRVPQNEMKQLEAQIRLHWQTSSQWPFLLRSFFSLAEKTLNGTPSSQSKNSFFKRIFNRDLESKSHKNDQEIMMQISHTLAGLMNNLSLPSHYDEDILDLKKALLGNDNIQQLPGLLDEVINLIMIAIGKTQESLANYLNQLNKQLASINESISSSYHSQKTLSESREGFNSKLQRQVTDTSQAIQGANDLESLKALINDRLSTISSTMTEYKTQMVEQEKHATQSITLLKNKVTRMEKDTVSLRSLLQEKLAQAMTDSLTDLPNRTAYQDAILPLCKIMQKTQKSVCLAVCDIDHFKKVNDTWGHLAGDKVLRLVPKQIRTVLAKEDLIFRYGGEEFVVAFPNTTLAQAVKRAEDIRLAVAKTPFNMQGEPVSISISIGIAELQVQENPESLFARADKQLYLAKEAGRNRVMANK